VAYVVTGDDQVSGPALLRAVHDQLPPYQCPREVHLVAELPRNELGKLLRAQLREVTAT
jgi:acyl-coenzyme A synthetase/AMP-(fatty) acid ligase